MVGVDRETGQTDVGDEDILVVPAEDQRAGDIETLEFIDDEEALPWLESDYDDEHQGADTGRIVGFVLLSLVALALILAAIWYFLQDRSGADLQPEGSTIAAPEGPVKVRPENGEGQTFEGTGNVAPTVGEGQTREGRLAEDEAPRPSVAAAVGESEEDTEVATPEAPKPPTASGVPVQVGAYSSRAGATAGWATLRGQTEILNGVDNRIVTGVVDGSTVYRLQAMASDGAAAEQLCNDLKSNGLACQVKR